MGIFFMQDGNNFMITGFNLNRDRTSLWITKLDGGSVEIVKDNPELANQVYSYLCDVAHTTLPTVMFHRGLIKSNVFQEGAEA